MTKIYLGHFKEMVSNWNGWKIVIWKILEKVGQIRVERWIGTGDREEKIKCVQGVNF